MQQVSGHLETSCTFNHSIHRRRFLSQALIFSNCIVSPKYMQKLIKNSFAGQKSGFCGIFFQIAEIMTSDVRFLTNTLQKL